MTDSSISWLAERPQLESPVLLVMLTGWIDAGGAGASAMEAIESECQATPIATFDDDLYIDFRARRPTMELREGINTVLQWSRINVSTGRDQAGHDLVLLTGPEPDMAWHRFCDAVGDLAVELGVTRMFALGAYPFAAPHTRTPRLSVSTPSQDVLASVRFMRSSVDVPAGVAASIEHAMHSRGIPALGIWVQVPHYITSMSYPAASVALLDSLREVADIVIDGAQIRQEAVIQRGRLDKLVADNAEHTQMLARLEELYDATDDPGATDLTGPSLELRSGDELAAELEQYLRDQD
ncbi:MAG: PAC2 family protein [Ilumatobacteraceae bacterium]